MGRAEDLFKRLAEGGETEIDLLVDDRQAEELFLDFKRSADNASGRRLHDTDRQNLAKAISGFGNSEGGVVVWGVDCRDRSDVGDVASEKIPVEIPQRFVSRLEGAVSGCTIPPHPGVRHAVVKGSSPSNGFVVSYIPKSPLVPHQCVRPPQYYMRAGSNFAPVPHGVLAGMFGRPPQPSLYHTWLITPVTIEAGERSVRRVRFESSIVLHNSGPGIARHVYVNYQLFPPESGMKIGSQILDQQWTGDVLAGMVVSIIAPESFRLAPGGRATAVSFFFTIEPEFSGEFTFRVSYGSDQAPMTSLEKKVVAADLLTLYEGLRTTPRDQMNDLFAKTLLPNYPDLE